VAPETAGLRQLTCATLGASRPAGEEIIIQDIPEASPRSPQDLTEAFQAAFEWLPVGVLMVSPDGVIVLTNRELERLLGYPRAELIGRAVEDVVPDASRPAHAELRRDYAVMPEQRQMGAGREVFARRKNGSEVPVEISLTPIRLRGAQLTIASVLDLTDRRRAHDALRRTYDERLQFETIVSEIGADFINRRADELDRAIEDALARIVRELDLDRSAFFQVLEESGDFVHTHQWTRAGWAPAPPRVSARGQFPWHLSRLSAGEIVCFETLDDVPDAIDRRSLREIGTKSGVSVPVLIGGQVWGAVTFAAMRAPRSWPPALLNRLRVVAAMFANVVGRSQGETAIRRAIMESAAVRERLRDENAYLREELRTLTGTQAIVGNSPAIRRVLAQVRQVAPTDSPVLLVGEIGTGKTLLAAHIHDLSPRRERSIIRVNAASLTTAWLDRAFAPRHPAAELAAGAQPRGELAFANHSTVLIDEVADLPLDVQAQLAALMQQRQLPLAGRDRIDIRIIAATRRDLAAAVEDGSFREELYYQLNVFTIALPPLRERPEDIPTLVWRFVDEFAGAYGKAIDAIDEESMAALERQDWPGNARELRNVVERAMIVADSRRLHIPARESLGKDRQKPRKRASRTVRRRDINT